MTELLLLQGVLAALVVLWLGWRLGRPARHTAAQDRAAVYRSRRQELAADRAAGLVDESQYQSLIGDLEQQLTNEYQEDSTGFEGKTLSKGRWYAAAFVLLFSLGLYLKLGYAPDLWVAEQQQAFTEAPSEQTQRAFEEALKTGLALRPDRIPFMMPLAELAMQRGEYAAARDYYRRLAEALPEHGSLVAKWVQADYMANDRRMTPGMRIKLQQVLAKEPTQTTALGLLGIAAFEAGKDREALKHWQALLGVLPPDSPRAGLIRNAMAQARQRMGLATPAPEQKTANAPALQVEVSVADSLQSAGGQALFVIARSPDSRIPVAVRKLPVPTGSVTVDLGNAHSMQPGRLLFDQKQLVISARISRTGQPMAASGDLQGETGTITTPAPGSRITLVIDRVVD